MTQVDSIEIVCDWSRVDHPRKQAGPKQHMVSAFTRSPQVTRGGKLLNF